MKATQLIHVLLLATVVALMTTGCEKFRENRQYDATLDHSVAESSFNDIYRVVEQLVGTTRGLVSDTCIAVTGSTAEYPTTLNIDFGAEQCADLYDVKRSGSMSLTLTDDWLTTGAQATVVPNNLMISGFGVTGTLSLVNLGYNTSNQREVGFKVTDAVITQPDGSTVAWSCDRLYTLVDANNAALIFDDEYNITGTAEGINNEGRAFQVVITTPLIWEAICRWVRSGNTKITVEDLKEREVFYGTDYCVENADCCDNIVDVKVNGKKEHVVRLR